MPFAAIDLHKKVVEAAVLDENGNLLCRDRFPATREALTRFARQRLSPQHLLAVEATTNTWPVVELLAPFVQEVVVSNPMRTRAIASAKIKTDKVDALVLAQLLRAGYLPRVWYPDPETQAMRRQSTARAVLVADRTRLKNRIHSVLHHRLISNPDGDLSPRPTSPGSRNSNSIPTAAKRSTAISAFWPRSKQSSKPAPPRSPPTLTVIPS